MNKGKKNDIPKNWSVVTIDDISLKIHYGYTATSVDEDADVKYLRITDISENGVNWETVPNCKIPDEDLERYLLKENDLVFARTGGTVGKSYLLRGDVPKAVFASYLIRIIPSSFVNPKYISYFFQSIDYWEQIELNKTGLKTNVNAQILSKIKFNLPPSFEQDQIVLKIDQLFSEIEKGKEQLEKIKQRITTYRQSILKAALEGELTKEWRANQQKLKTRKELIAEIKAFWAGKHAANLGRKSKSKAGPYREIRLIGETEQSILPKLPLGWHWVYLGAVTDNDSIRISPEDKPRLKFIGMDCIEPYSMKPHKFYNFSEMKSPGNYFVEGNVLYGRMRPYLNKVYKADFKGACSGEFIVLSCTNSLHPDFLKYKLHSSEFVNYASHKTTGDRPRISYEEMAEYPIPLCSLGEQEQVLQIIESKLSLCDNLQNLLDKNIQQMESLRQSIFQKAFQGKLTATESKGGSTTSLLEEIAKERLQFLSREEQIKKVARTSNTNKMAEEIKSILQLLQQSKKPIATHKLWQASEHKDDIDSFYSAVKKLVDSGKIKEAPRKGKESFLTISS